MKKSAYGAILFLAVMARPVAAQDGRSQAAIAEQREKIQAFNWADGIWRGVASYKMGANEGKLIQVERVGDYLDGTVKIVEGRGYVEATGKSVFNALAIIKWHPDLKQYRFHSFAQGNAGVFPVALQKDGYDWWVETPAGKMLYETRVAGGVWHEVGFNIAANGTRTQFFEMTLKRVADGDWPKPVPMTVGK